MAEEKKSTGKVRKLKAGTEAGNGNFRIRISADKVLEFTSGDVTPVPEVIPYKDGKGNEKQFHTAELLNAYIAKDYLTEV